MRYLLLIFNFLFSFVGFSQNEIVVRAFKLLPNSYTPELTTTGKDSLIKLETYLLPGGDSLEQVQYYLTKDTNSLSIHYEFTTGQRAFRIMQIKMIQSKNNDTTILFSSFFGDHTLFNQGEFALFNLKNNNLKVLSKTNPAKSFIQNPTQFFKPNTPDSIKALTNELSIRFDIIEYKDKISLNFSSYSSYISDWLIKKDIFFYFNGTDFELENIK